MLSHVATSLTNSLPGGGGASFIGQVFFNDTDVTSATVPAGALFMFAEALGRGGNHGTSSSGSAGAAGTDAIVAVTAGTTVTVTLASYYGTGTPVPTTIAYGGSTILTANSSIYGGASSSVPGATGKYPGGAGSTAGAGRGGGRLAGRPGSGSGDFVAGLGSGARGAGSTLAPGGYPAACLTFFTTYEAALAFAKSLHGGTWS